MKVCGDCMFNDDGLCDRYGRLVNDDDTCVPVIEVKCSWCGKTSKLRKLEPDKSKNSDYSFICWKCKERRYVRKKDVNGG